MSGTARRATTSSSRIGRPALAAFVGTLLLPAWPTVVAVAAFAGSAAISASGASAAIPATASAEAAAVTPTATATERRYLSGTGFGETEEWEFRIDRGRGADSGDWAKIPVPSQWELQGFGTYQYGREDDLGGEVGSYRHGFTVPESWRGRHVDLVFEGVMTDAEVRINSESAGPVHQGGFTRFSFDVTRRLRFGSENLLEVRVSEASADRSVNEAEREADYWIFGGIFRPVYLEASPASRIAYAAVDAGHDGRFAVDLEIEGASGGDMVTAEIFTSGGRSVGESLTAGLARGAGRLRLEGRFGGIEPWSAENPRLYEIVVTLARAARGGGEETPVHRTSRRFGFRTVEIRPGDGLYVNGHRTLLRGINRHSFWPDSGRTLNRGLNYRDAELIKELNANAVRASHYPPDVAFLEACDELGLYVIDELPGWQDAYDDEVGERLVREMVRRDVNHPSVILWANGNEGGWNRGLDREFARHDPQGRPVIHPDERFAGLDTEHYPTWDGLRRRLDRRTFWNTLRRHLGPFDLVMPTEMLHGLYDGGLGAGLEDFWELIRTSPIGAGGFLWAFLDEGVVRTDRDGEIDTHGNFAPDGLVGPYRSREPSFRTVRRVWSPVVPVDSEAESRPRVENRFTETDLSNCLFLWRSLRWPGPFEGTPPEVIESGEVAGPQTPPGSTGSLDIRPAIAGDALEITAVDPHGWEILTWVLPRQPRAALRSRWIVDASDAGDGADPASRVLRAGQGALEGENRRALFEAGRNGVDSLDHLEAGGVPIPLSGGPLQGPGTWSMTPDQWLRLNYREALFDLPEGWLRRIEWLGYGPDPVWANRLAGPRLGVWGRNLEPLSAGRSGGRGFYRDIIWMNLIGETGVLTIVPGDPPEAHSSGYLGVSAPTFPEDARTAQAPVPPVGSLSLPTSIPPIGTKFHPGSEMAEPASSPAGDGRSGMNRTVWLFWQGTDDR